MKCSVCGVEVEGNLANVRAHAYGEHPEEMARRRAERERKKAARDGRAAPVAPLPEPTPLEAAIADAGGEERRPAVPATLEEEGPARPGWRARLWGRGDDKPPTPDGKERRPKTKRTRAKRVPTAKILGTGWGLTGFAVSQVDGPVGRAMILQADYAGDILEALTKDTVLDGPLQFIAEREQTASAAASLLGLPALIYLFERATPELATMLQPLLVMALRQNMVAMAEAAAAAKAEEAKLAAAASELGIDGDDPLDALLARIFGPPEEEAPAPAPDAARAAV